MWRYDRNKFSAFFKPLFILLPGKKLAIMINPWPGLCIFAISYFFQITQVIFKVFLVFDQKFFRKKASLIYYGKNFHSWSPCHCLPYWRRHPDLNRGITVLQTVALTTWLCRLIYIHFVILERKKGFEPSTLALARRCSTAELLPH